MNKKLLCVLLISIPSMTPAMYRPKTMNARRALQTTIPNRTFFSPVLIVHQGTQAIIERWGKMHRVVEPGLRFKIPIMETVRKTDWGSARVDMREKVESMPPQRVITQDNVNMTITALIYYRIKNAQEAVYNIEHLPDSINKLAQTTLRNLIGSTCLDKTLTSRNVINANLCAQIEEAARKWGVTVTRVELQEVSPPAEIMHAMEKEMTAERNRRADILDAEGKKKAAILAAEGVSTAARLEAEGKAIARKTLANAEAESIKVIQNALSQGEASTKYLVAMEYMKMLPQMAKGEKGKTVVVPYNAAPLASVTTMLKEILATEVEK